MASLVITYNPVDPDHVAIFNRHLEIATKAGKKGGAALEAARDGFMEEKRKEANAVSETEKLIAGILNGKGDISEVEALAAIKALRQYAAGGEFRAVKMEDNLFHLSHSRNAARSPEGTDKPRIAGSTKCYYVRLADGKTMPIAKVATELHKVGEAIDATCGRHPILAMGLASKVPQGKNSYRDAKKGGLRVFAFNPAENENGVKSGPNAKGWHEFLKVAGTTKFIMRRMTAAELKGTNLPEKPFAESEAVKMASAKGVLA